MPKEQIITLLARMTLEQVQWQMQILCKKYYHYEQDANINDYNELQYKNLRSIGIHWLNEELTEERKAQREQPKSTEELE